jgi:hypothetical protein
MQKLKFTYENGKTVLANLTCLNKWVNLNVNKSFGISGNLIKVEVIDSLRVTIEIIKETNFIHQIDYRDIEDISIEYLQSCFDKCDYLIIRKIKT